MYEYGGSLTENIPPPSSTMHSGSLSSVSGALLLLGPDAWLVVLWESIFQTLQFWGMSEYLVIFVYNEKWLQWQCLPQIPQCSCWVGYHGISRPCITIDDSRGAVGSNSTSIIPLMHVIPLQMIDFDSGRVWRFSWLLGPMLIVQAAMTIIQGCRCPPRLIPYNLYIHQKTGEQVVGVPCDQRQHHISAFNLLKC